MSHSHFNGWRLCGITLIAVLLVHATTNDSSGYIQNLFAVTS